MYTATNWQDGDVITAAKLNKLEDGLKSVECKVFAVRVSYDEGYTPDKTFAEVQALLSEGYIPLYDVDDIDVGRAIHFPTNYNNREIIIGDSAQHAWTHDANGFRTYSGSAS